MSVLFHALEALGGVAVAIPSARIIIAQIGRHPSVDPHFRVVKWLPGSTTEVNGVMYHKNHVYYRAQRWGLFGWGDLGIFTSLPETEECCGRYAKQPDGLVIISEFRKNKA